MKKFCLVIFSFLILFGAPLKAYSWLGNEFMIDTNKVYKPASGRQEQSFVLFDGINYFVVWRDYRNNYNDRYSALYGTRITQDGKILDPTGILISPSLYSQRYAHASFDSNNYFVVWEEYAAGHINIHGARVTKEGQVLDISGFPITGFESGVSISYAYPSIAFDGTNYLVGATDDYSQHKVHAVRVDQSGKVIDSIPIIISPPAKTTFLSDISFDGTNYFPVWLQWNDSCSGNRYDLFGSRVSPNSTVIDSNGVCIVMEKEDQRNASIAFGGSNYFVVWEDWRQDSLHYSDIYGARVTKEGTLIDSTCIKISPPCSSRLSYGDPLITFDGENYFVVWEKNIGSMAMCTKSLYGTKIDTAGKIIDSQSVSITNTGTVGGTYYLDHSVASNKNNYFIVYNHFGDICGTFMDHSGNIIKNNMLVSTDGYRQYDQKCPSVASDGKDYFVVWEDYSDETYYKPGIYGTRVSEDGVTLDTASILLAEASSAYYNFISPVVAFDGTNYLVVWVGAQRGIYGAQLNKNGEILKDILISDTTFASSPALAFDGTNYLLTWAENTPIPCKYENDFSVYGVRISKQGVILDSIIQISDSNSCTSAVSFDGTNYLVVSDSRPQEQNIYGTRVDKNGIVLDTSDIIISCHDSIRDKPSISFDGTNYLVVWQDFRNGASDIYGVRVNQQGTVLDSTGIVISNAPGNQLNPSVAFDGNDYLVAWQDFRNPTDTSCIYATYVSPDGVVLDTNGFIMSTSKRYLPRLAYGANKQCFLTYEGAVYTPNYNATRILGRICSKTGITENNILNSFGINVSSNPFIKSTLLRYNLPIKSRVSLTIYDVCGRTIKTLINELKPAGSYSIPLSATDLKTGIYFVRLTADNTKLTKKLILMK
ncbi:MAG: T9SS type A sorting domain-containing protein [bacterium]